MGIATGRTSLLSESAVEAAVSAANRRIASLAELAQGDRCRVTEIQGQTAVVNRLSELGLCAGTEVEFERPAPLGDPLVFHFRGTRLALRRSEARLIRVCVNAR